MHSQPSLDKIYCPQPQRGRDGSEEQKSRYDGQSGHTQGRRRNIVKIHAEQGNEMNSDGLFSWKVDTIKLGTKTKRKSQGKCRENMEGSHAKAPDKRWQRNLHLYLANTVTCASKLMTKVRNRDQYYSTLETAANARIIVIFFPSTTSNIRSDG